MSRTIPDQILATPVSELANLASDSLFQVKNDAADLLAIAKALVEHIDRALDLKYVDRAHQLRLDANKDKSWHQHLGVRCPSEILGGSGHVCDGADPGPQS